MTLDTYRVTCRIEALMAYWLGIRYPSLEHAANRVEFGIGILKKRFPAEPFTANVNVVDHMLVVTVFTKSSEKPCHTIKMGLSHV